MFPHLGVHGGCHDERRARREHRRGEHVVGETRHELRKSVRGRRGDDDGVRLLAEVHVRHSRALFEGDDRVPADGLPGHGADEAQGVLRRNHMNLMSGLAEKPGKKDCLVGGDPAGDAEYDVHRFILPQRGSSVAGSRGAKGCWAGRSSRVPGAQEEIIVCTAVIEVPESPEGAMRVLAVRDEDPSRPWDPLGEWWPARPGVVGVHDRLAGGAWLAAQQREGRLVLILNRAEVSADQGSHTHRPAPKSRGTVVLDELAGAKLEDPPQTAGFNMLTVAGGWAVVTQWDGVAVSRRTLEPGVHMLAHHDVDDTVNTARIARWLPEYRALAGLPDDAWRAAWVALLSESAGLGAADDRAIIRDNRAHGYPTQSLLVCLAEVANPDAAGRGGMRIDSAVLAEPAQWRDPRFDRYPA